MGGEVGSLVGGPVGGEVGSLVGGPVGGEVGSKIATLERVIKQVFGVITALRPESSLVRIVGVLSNMHTEWKKDEHDVHTRIINDFEAAVVGRSSK